MLQVLPDLSWQWRPDAAVTAVDSTQRCTALALQYSDCVIVRVRPSAWPPLRRCRPQQEPLGPEETSDATNDIELQGHLTRVTSLRFHACVDSTDVLLASASSDRVLVWHFDGAFHVQRSVVVDKLYTEPSCVAFDHTGTLLAIACERDVEIRVIHSGDIVLTLEGHSAKVTRCEFHPLRQHLLITCSEDRTFKIWDLAAKALLFQSAVLSAFPILSVSCNPVTGDACFGFADGSIRVFTIQEAFARERAVLDLEAFLRRYRRKQQELEDQLQVARQSTHVISALPSWARSDSSGQSSVVRRSSVDLSTRRPPLSPHEDHIAEVATPVLGMRHLCVDVVGREQDLDHAPDRFNTHGVEQLLDREQHLVAATPSHLLAINALSLEITVLQDLQLALESQDPLDPVTVARDVCFHGSDGSDVMFCGLVSAFLPCFTMKCISVRHTDTHSAAPAATRLGNQRLEELASRVDPVTTEPSSCHSERVSVIATGPPPAGSVLNLPPLSSVSAGRRTPPPKKGDKKAVVDKPITFRTRIRSSGYGATAPFGVKRPSSADKKKRASTATTTASVDSFLKEYPRDCGVLQHYQSKHALPPKTLHHGAIHHIEFSPDAKWLASAGNDKLALVSRLPFSRFQGEGNVLAGHDHAVRAVRWSHSNRLVLTTSSDKTARLWLADSDAPLLTFHGAAPASTSAATTATSMSLGHHSSAKRAIRSDVVDATFFYMDRFVLSATGNAVRLYQFEVDEVFARAQTKQRKRNDLLHDENQSRKKKAAEWRWTDMQSVTSLTCVNGSFLSSIVLAAGSDRSLRVLDAAAGRTVRVIREAHARAAHSVALPRASSFVSHAANFYDLLLSSAPNSTIHLWDIRADNCVLRFGEHVNRVHQLGVAFSPCMRFVATGSEDRLTYLYDVRTGRCLTRLQGHADVVTSVAFNPLHPQLATASYDGSIRFYSDRATD